MSDARSGADGATVPRGRPFPKGVSPNPGGRPKAIAALEAQIREKHAPKVLEVLDELHRLSQGATRLRVDEEGEPTEIVDGPVRVAAARLYLDRVLGPARAPVEMLPPPVPSAPANDAGGLLEPVDAVALSVTERTLRLIAGQVAALEAKAGSDGLSHEEAASLASLLRAVDGIGRWHERIDADVRERFAKLSSAERQAATERYMCESLGISIDELAALRTRRAG